MPMALAADLMFVPGSGILARILTPEEPLTFAVAAVAAVGAPSVEVVPGVNQVEEVAVPV